MKWDLTESTRSRSDRAPQRGYRFSGTCFCRTEEGVECPLSDDGLSVASSVEVSHPSRVRIMMVDRFPKPSDPELQTAASQAGLLGPTTTGLTLGYSVLIRNGHMSRRLLSHECRHVYQFEQAGSIAAFLPLYFESIIQFGNWDSPFERDARAHELEEISTDA